MQHLVTASFDVVFEESDESYHVSDESQSVKQRGKGAHEGKSKGVRGHPGCPTCAQAPGPCVKRGGTSLTSSLTSKGVCGHAAKANARGLRGKHGGNTKSTCGHPGCTTKAYARGLCGKHGGKGACEHPGCPTSANSRGLCFKHGGDTRSVCEHPGCTTKAQARGLCFKHGGSTTGV
jgi:hypothetical protein